jgi:hypothetical protein
MTSTLAYVAAVAAGVAAVGCVYLYATSRRGLLPSLAVAAICGVGAALLMALARSF